MIKLEWLKFRNNLVFQFMLGLFFICQAFLLLIGREFDDLPPPLPNHMVFFQFPTVFEYQSYIGNWLAFFFLGFVAIFMTTSEFSNKTLRQNIITGLTRVQIFKGKMGFAAIIAVLATCFYFLTSLIYGFIYTPDITLSLLTENFRIHLHYFVMAFGYMSFGIMLAMVFRRSGLAMFLYFAFIMFLEPLIRWAIHFQIAEHRSFIFYPMNALEDLTPNPLAKLEDAFSNIEFNIFMTPNEALVTSLIYISIFVYLIYWKIKNADL